MAVVSVTVGTAVPLTTFVCATVTVPSGPTFRSYVTSCVSGGGCGGRVGTPVYNIQHAVRK